MISISTQRSNVYSQSDHSSSEAVANLLSRAEHHVWGKLKEVGPGYRVDSDIERLLIYTKLSPCERRLAYHIHRVDSLNRANSAYDLLDDDYDPDQPPSPIVEGDRVGCLIEFKTLALYWGLPRQLVRKSLISIVADRLVVPIQDDRYVINFDVWDWHPSRVSKRDIVAVAIPAWFDPRLFPVHQKQPIPQSLRTAVFERDAYRCVYCGDYKGLSADHVIPESKGGSTTLDNLVAACRKCNSKKGTKLDFTGPLQEGGENACS